MSFYVDGQLMKTWTDGTPQTSVHLMLNTWFPGWLEGRKHKRTLYTLIDSISYAP